MHLGFEDDTAAMQLKVAQIGPLLPPPQRRSAAAAGAAGVETPPPPYSSATTTCCRCQTWPHPAQQPQLNLAIMVVEFLDRALKINLPLLFNQRWQKYAALLCEWLLESIGKCFGVFFHML